MSNNHSVPLNVLKVIDKYKKTNERPEIFPCEVDYGGEKYFSLRYIPSNRFLVIRKDGSIPPFEEIKPVLKLTTNMSGINNVIYIYEKDFVNKNNLLLFNRIRYALTKIDRSLGSNLPNRMKQAFAAFLEMANKALEYQKDLEVNFKHADELITKSLERKLVTEQDCDMLHIYYRNLLSSEKNLDLFKWIPINRGRIYWNTCFGELFLDLGYGGVILSYGFIKDT